MSEHKFTPGPWRCSRSDMESFDGITGKQISFVYPGEDERIAVKTSNPVEDARLIAAAPDLYEALAAMAEHFGPLEDNIMLNDECRRCFALARAALAKATAVP